MKTKTWISMTVILMLGLALAPALLAQAGSDQSDRSLATLILAWLPLVLIVVLWFLFAKQLKTYKELRQRSLEHMDRLEALLERVASATERSDQPPSDSRP